MDFSTILIIAVVLFLAWLVFGGSSDKKKTQSVSDNKNSELREPSFTQPKVQAPESSLYSLQITYKSYSGEITSRNIEVVDTNKTGHIKAYCHLREDYRTFNLSSVLSCIDLMTGEAVEDLNGHLGVVPSMEQKYQLADKFIADYKDELAILLFVGKADGRLMKPERLLISNYLETRTGETDHQLIDNVISFADVPSLTSYKRAVGRVSKENMHVLSHLYDTSKKIVATQKKVTGSEQEALDYIRSRLGIPA